MPAQFDKNNYDRGQFTSNMDELYCEPCHVQVKTRDQMQSYEDGQRHKKLTSKVVRYTCDLCLVTVPCQGLRRQCALYLKSIGLSTKSRAEISSRIG